jgi:hypothetical protein
MGFMPKIKCFLLLFLPLFGWSQFGIITDKSNWEIGLNIGPMNFLGDLGGNKGKGTLGPKDNNIPMTNFNFGISASYFPKKWLAARLAFSLGRMEGDDRIIKADFDNSTGFEIARKHRNLTFRSPLYEGFLAAELYPTVFFRERKGEGVPRFRPYLVAGIGLFAFKPQGLYTKDGVESWVDLKPLRTEGQGMAETGVPEYNTWSYCIPLGIGIKYDISERVSFAIEFVHRITGTDYIDDVSTKYVDPGLFDFYLSPDQAEIAKYMSNPSAYFPGSPGYTPYAPGKKRGNPLWNDSYLSSTFRFTYKLGDSYAEWFQNKKSIRCINYF